MLTRENGCYRISILGLVLLTLIASVMLAIVGWRVWDASTYQREVLAELDSQREAWQALNIHSYRVTYTNCSGSVCCQDEPITIRTGVVFPAPDCAQGRLGGNFYASVYELNTVDQMYEAVENWLDTYDAQDMTIAYHPDYHYITSVSFDQFTGPLTIEYHDLEPLQ